MHAVVRNYSGPGAKELLDVLEQRKSEVEEVIRSVPGFQAYTLLRTDDGGVSVTVCEDKAGTEHSVQLARDWIAENASGVDANPPAVSEGSVILQLS
jgi:heme-degrading monooxygenase HmoA